ncbi:MAG: transporter ATP-binding protein [Rhizobacter sp.]|nr:transporter ATP-binding protein [Rhizobacter sp.]
MNLFEAPVVSGAAARASVNPTAVIESISTFADGTQDAHGATAVLQVDGLFSGYGRIGVLEDVSLRVRPHEIVTVLGSNGAGKSTLLKTISGLLATRRGRIDFFGGSIGSAKPQAIVDQGLLHVAEGRRLFRTQTVLANMELGLYGSKLSRADERVRMQQVFDLFPALHGKRTALAGALSGGQQQMLAVAQALMRSPRLLMLDEPSLGLAPVIVDQVMDVVIKLRSQGCAILLVEQLVERALDVADTAYVMRSGRMLGSGPARSMRDSDLVRQAYMTA